MEDAYEGSRHASRCMGNSGICRKTCRKSEKPYFYCRDNQPCCLQAYMRISVSGVEENYDWASEKRWPRIP
ncbi:beta-defensin 119-like [Otolemur garnettii]|uniref:beta-defensin 119-like n=1 Tax=Otolemur garnettii TaxID=30611 RepID=UPI000C7F33B9|nr:beta-defensin 119-like [Otolemur garnettii]